MSRNEKNSNELNPIVHIDFLQKCKNGVWGNIPEQNLHGLGSKMFVPHIIDVPTVDQQVFDTERDVTGITKWRVFPFKEKTVR